jgi:DNA processing protein
LIRQGAKLVETVDDILEELPPLYSTFSQNNEPVKQKSKLTIDARHEHLLNQIAYEITSLDAIILRSGLTAHEVSSMLLHLELQGLVETVRGGYLRILR